MNVNVKTYIRHEERSTNIDPDKLLKKTIKSGADEAELFISNVNARSYVIEKNRVTSTRESFLFGVGLRVIAGGKVGFAYTTSLNEFDTIIKHALKNSKLNKKLNYTFPDKAKVNKSLVRYSKKIAMITPNTCMEHISKLFDGIRSVNRDIVLAEGGVAFGQSTIKIANTHGLYHEEKSTFCGAGIFTVLKYDGDRIAAWGADVFSRTEIPDFEKLGSQTATFTVKSKYPVKAEAGLKTLVFQPDAILEVLEFALIPGFYGDAACRNESMFSNKLNEKIMHENIYIEDNPEYDAALTISCTDDEGVPTKKTTLVENGILKNYLFDSYSASEFGSVTTSNGIRGSRGTGNTRFKTPPAICARNIMIKAEMQKFDELLKTVKNGILVDAVLGAHTANPATGTFSINVPQSFLIENGELTTAVQPFMAAGQISEILKKGILVGDNLKPMVGKLSPVGATLPTIVLYDIPVAT